MTSTASPLASGLGASVGSRVREALSDPALRRSLAAMVRRRVPANDAEDVAQTILCDALAAPGIPTDPEDLRRFVAGIARHKVADFHRRARRSPAQPELQDELSVAPAPLEARALLSRIASSLAGASSSREQETLEWLVREHAGEQLQTIAAETGLPAPAVRQRVSRLRRVLRAQWAHALALLAVAGSCGALAERAHRERSAIVADPTGDPVARAATLAQGRWSIETISARDEADGATVAAQKVVDIRIAGRRVELVGPVHTAIRTIGAASRRSDGTLSIDLLDDNGVVQHVTAEIEGDHMRLTVHDGRFRGTARLLRH